MVSLEPSNRFQGIDSKESIPPANVAWRASTTTLFLLGSWLPSWVVLNSRTEVAEFGGGEGEGDKIEEWCGGDE